MPEYTEERREFHKTLIRELMVRDPNMSARGAEKVIAEQKSMTLDRIYIGGLMKEIDQERIAMADETMLSHYLGMFMERIRLADIHLWNILTNVDDKGTTKRDRIAAARELRNNFVALMQTMFDAGVFKRKLGQLDMPNMGAILDMAKRIENGEHINTQAQPDGTGGDVAGDTEAV